MMRKTVSALLVLTVCIGIASTAHTISRDPQSDSRATGIEEVAPAGRSLDFEYQFALAGDDGRYVGQLGALNSGDRFSVRMRARARAYAYVFVSNGEGGFDLIATDGEQRATSVAANTWVTVPDARSALRLDDNSGGVERIYLVVASRPVGDIERLRDEEASVSEVWLLGLRAQLVGKNRWSREHRGASIRAQYAGGAAVEDAAFTHR
jgi:hypothetical protein